MSDTEVQLGCTLKTQNIIHTSAFGFILVSLSLNIVSIFGASWLDFDGSTSGFRDNHVYFGVARNCWKMPDKSYCKYRDDLFRFKYLTSKEAVVLDVVFFQLVVSSLCYLVAVNCILLLFHWKDEEKIGLRKCSSVLSVLLTTIGAILNLSAMVYFQVGTHELPPRFGTSWTCITGWLSTATQIVSVVLCTVRYYRDPMLNQKPHSGVEILSTMNYPLERYFYGSSRNSSINNFNERWFDERYSKTATNGYIASGVTNNAYNGGI